jgi:hypothetical protein
MGAWCGVTALSLALAVPCWIAQSFTYISFLSTEDGNYTKEAYEEWEKFEPAIIANAVYMFFRPLSFALSSHSKIMLLNKVWHIFLSNRHSKASVLLPLHGADVLSQFLYTGIPLTSPEALCIFVSSSASATF